MKRLTRKLDRKMLFGVCAGLAEHFNVDVTLVRLAVVAVAIFSQAFPMLVMYIIAAIIIPAEE